ncbi:unnamed protein product [Mytilus edulis]|uniref:Transmembrane protein n=1 Tax=Mytilus edulis TaxID=6550 RepID=A0A8S3QIC2_MYTED|nr:unnamed protein product [Mytilus edulis]
MDNNRYPKTNKKNDRSYKRKKKSNNSNDNFKYKDSNARHRNKLIGCIWLLLLLATAAFVVGAVFFGGFSEHSKALQECERNETKALIKTSLEDHCSDATYKAFCICFIVGLVLFGLTTLLSCSYRSKENEKLHSRSHQVAPKTAAPKAAIKLKNKGNPENDQLKKAKSNFDSRKRKTSKRTNGDIYKWRNKPKEEPPEKQ